MLQRRQSVLPITLRYVLFSVMETLNSFQDVIDAFGGPSKFAAAIRIPGFHAQSMKTRDSIPPAYWQDTVAAARYVAIGEADAAKRASLLAITLEALAELARGKRKPSEASPADNAVAS